MPLRVKTSLTWKSSWANSHWDETDLIENRSAFISKNLDTNFAKIMLDGSSPTYTAAMLEPYEPSAAFGSDHRGKLMIEPDQLALDIIELDRRGLSVKIHASGDRSLRVALDAIEAARKTSGDSGLIHEIAHAEIIHPDDLSRFKELNVAAEMCPILWHPVPRLHWETWLGKERAKIWPVKRLVESRVLVTYDSDWPEQAVDLQTAIRIFTINGATANRVVDSSGSLEIGKDTDLIALDRNIFDVDITEAGETKIVMSVVDGETIYKPDQ